MAWISRAICLGALVPVRRADRRQRLPRRARPWRDWRGRAATSTPSGARTRQPLMLAAASALRSSTAVDLLGHGDGRHADHVLDFGQPRRQIVGGRLAGRQDRLADRPAALMRQHGIAQRLGGHVHRHQRVVGAGRAHAPNATAGSARRRRAHPVFRLVADEAIDHRIGRAAMRVPAHRVAQRQHVEGVEGDHAVEAVIIALGRMDRLGAAHLLGRLAGEAQRARDAVRAASPPWWRAGRRRLPCRAPNADRCGRRHVR